MSNSANPEKFRIDLDLDFILLITCARYIEQMYLNFCFFLIVLNLDWGYSVCDSFATPFENKLR